MVAGIPLDWIEEIKEQVFALEKAPILPPSHPFPENALNAEIKKRLGLDVRVEVKGPSIIDTAALKEQLSPTTTRLFSFSLAPFTAPVFAAIGHGDLTKIAAWLLASDMAAAVSLQSSFQESFYLFMGAVALDSLSATGHYKNNALRLLSTAADIKDIEPSVSYSSVISYKEEAVSLLILLPQALQKEMKVAAQKREDAYVTESLVSSKIHLAARLLLDLVPLNYSDIANMKEGSFLLLNKGSDAKKDSVQVIVGKRAFFAGQIAGDVLTITALAEPLEEIKKMDTPPEKSTGAGHVPPLPKPGNAPKAPGLPNPITAPPPARLAAPTNEPQDATSKTPAPNSAPSLPSKTSPTAPTNAASQQKPASAGSPLPPFEAKLSANPVNPAASTPPVSPTNPEAVPPANPKGGSITAPAAITEENPQDSKYFLGEDEEFFVEDEELKDVLKNTQPAATKASEKATRSQTAPMQTEEIDEQMSTSVADIPLQVEVVVGYMKMSIKDLLAMHVGGTYTLANPITSQVDLLINGKRIAKGELLKSGDTLGVRILSL